MSLANIGPSDWNMEKARQISDHVGGVDKENNSYPNGGKAAAATSVSKKAPAKTKPGIVVGW